MKSCKTCKHWHPLIDDRYGECMGVHGDSSLKFELEISDYGSAQLKTSGDFGCTEHEEIEDQNSKATGLSESVFRSIDKESEDSEPLLPSKGGPWGFNHEWDDRVTDWSDNSCYSHSGTPVCQKCRCHYDDPEANKVCKGEV